MAHLRPQLEGKVAIITGAASGIGEAAARLFASRGAIVVIADIQDDVGQSIAASIGPAEKCTYKHCDVRDEKQVEVLVDYTLQAYKRVDILYSNAGIGNTVTNILDANMEEWDNVFAVNVRGMAVSIKHAGRAMVARGIHGSIVCTASVAAVVALGGFTPYTATKSAVLGLVRGAAGELGPYGIRVNCVSPTALATPLTCGMTGWIPSKVEENSSSEASLKGVMLKTEDVAAAALFLASDEAAFISGHNLVLDGAMTVFISKLLRGETITRS